MGTWYSCVLVAILILIAHQIAFEIDIRILAKPLLVWRVPHMIFALTCLLIALGERQKIEVQTLQLMLWAQTLWTLALMWFVQSKYSASGELWIPLYGFQVVAIVAATLRYGNGFMANLILVGITAIEGGLFWWHFDLTNHQLLVQSGHAWTFPFVGLVIVMLLIARYSYERGIRKLLEFEIRAVTMERIARLLLTVRDRGNSPLQTLEIGLGILYRRADDRELTELLQRALRKLQALHRRFKVSEHAIDWGHEEILIDLNRRKTRSRHVPC